MSLINCPCGFFADGAYARDDYRRHNCPHHEAEEVRESSGSAWAGALVAICMCAVIVAVCWIGAGR